MAQTQNAEIKNYPGTPRLVYFKNMPGSLGGAAVWRLPLARGAILETRDRIPHRASGAWSLPASSSAYVSASRSLSLCDYHK